MSLWTRLIIILCRIISFVSQRFRFGAGGTWSGEIALRFQPNIVTLLVKNLRKGIILIAGTNGKTTTSLMIKTILEREGLNVVYNASGANLLNGIASALIQKSQADWAVFEIDENSLPIILQHVTPKIVILLNLFRDQLDRYGEVDVIVERWQHVLSEVEGVMFILNADDPGIAYLGKKLKSKVIYFGVNDKEQFLTKIEHATDSIFCLICGSRLSYAGLYFSHLGIWKCSKCGFRRPTPDVSKVVSPLPGIYNQYNALAAFAAAKFLGVQQVDLSGFLPAFGRQEEIEINGKKIKIFLAKNPSGFNASLRTVIKMKAKYLWGILNDRIPDGRDVSWIWDVDFEMITPGVKIFVSGDRRYDLALRLKYAGFKAEVIKNVNQILPLMKNGETLFILPTYSAMLEVRKSLIGRKIL